jgi:hypothetical protein
MAQAPLPVEKRQLTKLQIDYFLPHNLSQDRQRAMVVEYLRLQAIKTNELIDQLNKLNGF